MFNNFVQRRKLYYLFSGVLILLGILAMIYSFIRIGTPLLLGVDFLGGTRFEVQFTEAVTEAQIRDVFSEFDVSNPLVTALQGQGLENAWQVRTKFLTVETSRAIEEALAGVSPLTPGTTAVTNISPAIGNEVTRAALVAILVVAAVILVYIMFVFRQVPHSFRYGACAVAALFHDLLILFGFIAIMGVVAGWEVDALFLTAVLTVSGFSLQDTIIVFDRIRENLGKRQYRNYDFESIVNLSMQQTIKRSVISQLNAMFIMLAILFFGGESIKPFIAVLLVGLLSGTYSSIFFATPLLVSWEKGEIPLLKPRPA
jgi:preprotein translocase SecF subunit